MTADSRSFRRHPEASGEPCHSLRRHGRSTSKFASRLAMSAIEGISDTSAGRENDETAE